MPCTPGTCALPPEFRLSQGGNYAECCSAIRTAELVGHLGRIWGLRLGAVVCFFAHTYVHTDVL